MALITNNNAVVCYDQELLPFISHPDHQTILQQPGDNVQLRPGKSIGPLNSVGKYDLRVVESLLIQSRGSSRVDSEGEWVKCEECMKGNGPYQDCLYLEGYFHNACGNCKRKDHAVQCTTGDGGRVDKEDDYEGSDKKAAQVGKAKKVEMITRSGRTTTKPTKYAV